MKNYDEMSFSFYESRKAESKEDTWISYHFESSFRVGQDIGEVKEKIAFFESDRSGENDCSFNLVLLENSLMILENIENSLETIREIRDLYFSLIDIIGINMEWAADKYVFRRWFHDSMITGGTKLYHTTYENMLRRIKTLLDMGSKDAISLFLAIEVGQS
jgi:hypothetical protein